MANENYTSIIWLTQGGYTVIDNEDYGKVSLLRWFFCNTSGYVVDTLIPHQRLHRFILKAKRGTMIDHADMNKLNNRKSNLRFCDKSQNAANVGARKTNKSGYKGVSWCRRDKKWQASIQCRGKSIALGRHIDIVDAAKAYNEAAIKYFGEFAYLNVV